MLDMGKVSSCFVPRYVLKKSPDPCCVLEDFFKIYLFYLFNFGFTGSSLLFRLSSSCSEPGLFSSCGARVSPCSAWASPCSARVSPRGARVSH